MIKMVIQDFCSTRNQAFREGWNKAGTTIIGIWFVFNMVAGVCASKNQWNMFPGIFLTTELLVFWCTFLLHAMYPNRLGKLMFLMPMDQEGKQQYLKTAYWFKGLTMSGVQILVMLIFVLWGQIHPGYAALLVFSFFTFNLIKGLENFYGQFHLLSQEGSRDAYKMEWCAQWFSVAVFGLLMIGGAGTLGSKSLIVCSVTTIIQAILCICIVEKRYKQQMEQGLSWEQVQYRKGGKCL